jgi:hypothetical protein
MAAKEIRGIKVLHAPINKGEKPDLIFNIMPFEKLEVQEGVPSCYWEIDCHLIQGRKTEYYEKVDKVYIAQSPFLGLYPKEKSFYLPLACDPERHKRISGVSQQYDIGFLGNDTYPERRTLLEQLQCNFNVLRDTAEPGIPYSTKLSGCKIIFNRSLSQDVNMRFFEAISIGRLLLTDYLPAQDDFAVIGEHYDTYKDFEDLKNKVKKYLKEDKLREKIATDGADHMHKNHTYKHRLLSVLEDFGFKQ